MIQRDTVILDIFNHNEGMGKIDFPLLIVAKIRILFNNGKNIIIFLNTNLTNSTNNKQKTRKPPSYSISLSDFCSISSYMFFMSKLLSPYPLNSAPGYVRLYYVRKKPAAPPPIIAVFLIPFPTLFVLPQISL